MYYCLASELSAYPYRGSCHYALRNKTANDFSHCDGSNAAILLTSDQGRSADVRNDFRRVLGVDKELHELGDCQQRSLADLS